MAEKYTVQLIEKKEVAESTMRFRFTKPEGFTHRAGQTVDVSIENPAYTDEKGNSRTFSLITAPSEDTLAVTTRLRGSAFKRALSELPDGSDVQIEGPHGSFNLHQNAERPAVFLVGGIGITPFMSIIKDAVERDLPHKMFLFYSNRRPEDAAYISELQELASSHEKFHFVPTMTEMDQSKEAWSGETGYVTWEMVERHIPDLSGAIYYMAGPDGMVRAMRTMLIEHGISEDDIKTEEFSGY